MAVPKWPSCLALTIPFQSGANTELSEWDRQESRPGEEAEEKRSARDGMFQRQAIPEDHHLGHHVGRSS